MKEENKAYFACYIVASNGTLWYSFGTSEEHLTDGLSGMEAAYVAPCTEEAYRLACEGKWDQIMVNEEEEIVEAGDGSKSLNYNDPIVHALVEGRDLSC